MSGLNTEALAFSILWVLLASAAFMLFGWTAGLIMSGGIFLAVSASSAIIYSTSGNIALERGVRWAILVGGALILLSMIDLAT